LISGSRVVLAASGGGDGMGGFVRVRSDREAAHRGAVSAIHSNESADAVRAISDPRAQSLLQMRQALDQNPRVQSQAALPRPRPRDGWAAAKAPPKRKENLPVQKKPNATGLPDRLKAGVESLSGLAMDDVRVHYNSPKPAAVQAHAYTQGADIHVAPGQEKH